MRHSTGEQRTPGHSFNGFGTARHPAAAADAPADAARKSPFEQDALKLLIQQFAELREYASCYAAARIDGATAFVRSAIIRLALAALGFVAVSGFVILASGFVLSGVAQGLGTLFGDRAWLGTLLTGIAALVAVGVAVGCVVVARREKARNRTVEKYEERNARQRTRFGRDVRDQAATGVARSE